jgi:hypothetical protein
MDERRGSVAKGVLTLLAMGINLVFWVALLLTVALLKFLVPIPAWRRVSSRWMVALAENWISGNTAIFDLTGALPREIHGVDGLRRREWSCRTTAPGSTSWCCRPASTGASPS